MSLPTLPSPMSVNDGGNAAVAPEVAALAESMTTLQAQTTNRKICLGNGKQTQTITFQAFLVSFLNRYLGETFTFYLCFHCSRLK